MGRKRSAHIPRRYDSHPERMLMGTALDTHCLEVANHAILIVSGAGHTRVGPRSHMTSEAGIQSWISISAPVQELRGAQIQRMIWTVRPLSL